MELNLTLSNLTSDPVKKELQWLLNSLISACRCAAEDPDTVAEIAAIRELDVNSAPEIGYGVRRVLYARGKAFLISLTCSSPGASSTPLSSSIYNGRPAAVEALLRLRPDLALDKNAFDMCFRGINPESSE